MGRRRVQNRSLVPERLRELDRTYVSVGIAVLIWLIVVTLPRVYPAAQQGPTCSDLAHPLGGNNQSILARRGDQELRLDLDMDSRSFRVGEPIQFRLTFVNEAIGPITLYLDGLDPVLSRNGTIALQITRSDNPLLGAVQSPSAPISYDSINLHLLGSRTRCNENFTITAETLQSIGLTTPGDYRMFAYYTNTSPGTIPTPVVGTATATAAYFDQGVWTGQVISDEVRFSILAPTVPTAAPIGPAG